MNEIDKVEKRIVVQQNKWQINYNKFLNGKLTWGVFQDQSQFIKCTLNYLKELKDIMIIENNLDKRIVGIKEIPESKVWAYYEF